MTARLSDDHTNAKRLAEGLADIKSLSIDPGFVKTNIVFFDVTRNNMTAEQLSSELASKGIKALPVSQKQLRAVTHYHVTSDDIDYALNVFEKVLTY